MWTVPTWNSRISPELFFNIISRVCTHGTSQIWYNNNLMNIQVGNCDRPSPSRDLLQTISVHTEDTSLDLYRDCYHWFRYAGIQSPVCCPSLKMVEPIWPTFFLARFIIFEIVLNPHIKADKSVIFFVIIFNRLADKSRTKNS